MSQVPDCQGSTQNDTFTCLRQASYDTVVAAGNATIIHAALSGVLFAFLPVLDGPKGVFPALPTGLYAKGQFARIPVLSGQNIDEGEKYLALSLPCAKLLYAFQALPLLPRQLLVQPSSRLPFSLSTT